MKHELTEGIDFYINKQGCWVFTEKYHLEKGYCCGMACLHCPFHFVNVPEPRRSEAIDRRIKKENS